MRWSSRVPSVRLSLWILFPFFPHFSFLVALLASLCVLHHKAGGVRVKFIYLQMQRTVSV